MSDAEEDNRGVRDISGSPIPTMPFSQLASQPAHYSDEDDDEAQQNGNSNADAPDNDKGDGGDGGDDSELSEVDEAEFADFDPTTVTIDERPAQEIDEDAARTLKASKRKREGDGGKKPKEGKREKTKKKRSRAERPQVEGDDYDSGADGEILEGKRRTKPKTSRGDGERREKDRARERVRERERMQALAEENMTEEQKRAAKLDAAMDAALKNPNKRRRRKDEVDLEEAADDEINELKVRMERACEDDNSARENGQPAINKLKMLPEVVAVLNRNTARHTVVDPETNFLQSVKFFLEPLNDGSLPAYNIQRDLFQALETLPIDKETLLASGIGKVVFYYTKSKKPEIGIKRIAERLLADWSRPILKRSDDYKKRKIATAEYDASAQQMAMRPAGSQRYSQYDDAPVLSQREMERERVLAQPKLSNRARLETHTASYTVAPRSNFDASRTEQHAKPLGAAGMEAFRKMTQKKVSRKQ